MWVDKYKPKHVSEVLGGSEVVNKLTDWLKKWDQVFLKKTLKVPFVQSGPSCRAVLMSGPPGIGKTTTATLVARSLGYEVNDVPYCPVLCVSIFVYLPISVYVNLCIFFTLLM